MRLYSKALLGGVAALALAGVTTGAANAMDSTNWRWNLLIDTNIDENIRINVNIDPVGKVLDEVFQMQIGDVTATSSVSDIYNWKPLEQVEYQKGYITDHTLTVDAGYQYHNGGSGEAHLNTHNGYTATSSWEHTLNGHVTTTEEDGPAGFIGGAGAVVFGGSIPPGAGFIAGAGAIGAIGAAATNGHADFDAALGGSSTYSGALDTASSYDYGYENGGSGRFNGHYNVTEGEVTTYYHLAPALQNATKELPKVDSIATAAGNVISVESDTPVQEHSLQVVFDNVDQPCQDCGANFEGADFDLDANLALQESEPNLDTGNHNHDVALLLGLAAGAGLIEQANISATSNANNIYNAQVNSTASAFGNLKSIDVATERFDNGLVLADISQLSVANVSADATAYDVHLVNYDHLGDLEGPIANATATAIGNVVNIKVNSSQGPAVNAPSP